MSLSATARTLVVLVGLAAAVFSPIAPATADGDLRLPEVVSPPGTWSSEEGVDGPVAAIGIATRTRPVGIFDSRENLSLFVVSAVDGSARWVKLPGFSLERWGFIGGVAVSPDGRWLGWVRPLRTRPRFPHSRVAGWSVMDTTTGAIRMLEVDEYAEVRGTANDLAFSGDSRYLLTSYEPPNTPLGGRSKAHQLVAWDVTTGAPTVVEPPGHYWLPTLGSAPSGVAWARGHSVYRFDITTGRRSTMTLPVKHAVTAWSPDDSAVAYLGSDPNDESASSRLFVATRVQGEQQAYDLPRTSPLGPLAWRDPTHVVVGNFRRAVYVVDINDGTLETVEIDGTGETLNTPYLASDLWQQPLGAAPERSATTDPRRPWRWAAGAGLTIAGGLLILRLRRSRGGPPQTPTAPASVP